MNAQNFLNKKAQSLGFISGGSNFYRNTARASKTIKPEPKFSTSRVLKGVRNGTMMVGAGTAAYASGN